MPMCCLSPASHMEAGFRSKPSALEPGPYHCPPPWAGVPTGRGATPGRGPHREGCLPGHLALSLWPPEWTSAHAVGDVVLPPVADVKT